MFMLNNGQTAVQQKLNRTCNHST